MSWVYVAVSAVSTGVSAYQKSKAAKKAGKQESISQVPMKEQFQMEAGENLSSIYQKYKDLYKPGQEYPGIEALTTPSVYEQQGLNRLQKYMEEPESKIAESYKDVLGKTLEGEYDPYTSPYYESMRRKLEKEKAQSIKSLNQMLGKGGLGGTSFRVGQLGDISQSTFDKISDVIAEISEKERTRQFEAVKLGMVSEELDEALARRKLSTTMDIGALPRELKGVSYKDFLRKQGEAAGVQDIGMGLFKADVPYGVKQFTYQGAQEPSTISNILDYAKIALQAYGTYRGGGAGGGFVQPGYGQETISGVMY